MAQAPKAIAPAVKRKFTALDLFQDDGAMKSMAGLFQRFVPAGVDGTRHFELARLAARRLPILAKAEAREVVRAFMGIAATGLEINSPLQQAFIIPFEWGGKVQFSTIIGYKGLIELAYRGDMVKAIHADVVTAEEVERGLFRYRYGTDPELQHEYGPNRLDYFEPDAIPPEMTPAFAYCVLSEKSGVPDFRVMPWKSVEGIRNNSNAYRQAKGKGKGSSEYRKSPWIAFPFQMGMKTVLRQKLKLVRITPEMATAIAFDEWSERNAHRFGEIIDLDPGAWEDLGLPDESAGGEGEGAQQGGGGQPNPPAARGGQRAAQGGKGAQQQAKPKDEAQGPPEPPVDAYEDEAAAGPAPTQQQAENPPKAVRPEPNPPRQEEATEGDGGAPGPEGDAGDEGGWY